MPATQMLYQAAGSPSVPDLEPASGACWLCGSDLGGTGVPRESAIKDTFTDHDKCASPRSTHLCRACVFCFSERVPWPGRDKLQRMRNYSHFVIGGQWLPLSKGDKAQMREILLAPPEDEWLGVVAESGQKHLIFRAPVALGASRCAIQFEEQQLAYAPRDLARELEVIETLYQAGFSKAEIETGDYNQARMLKAGLRVWRAAERQAQPWRGSVLFRLALFLAQKREQNSEGEEP